MPQSILKYDTEVSTSGRIELHVPLDPGSHVVVYVIRSDEHDDHREDLLAASQSSLDFWDNPFDDKDWNRA